MYYQNKIKNSTIPHSWFFFNPEVKSNYKNISEMTSDIGVVFLNESQEENKFFLKIEPYIKICKKRNLKFLVPYSIFWANKYKAFGMFIEANRKTANNLSKKKLPKKYFIASKVHNIKEASMVKKFVDFVFIAPVFKTKSYPEKKPLSNYIFISLCFFFKEEVIFGLGGINYKNFKSIRYKNLHGFGAITCFKSKYE